jgi:hypothetical protein
MSTSEAIAVVRKLFESVARRDPAGSSTLIIPTS